MERCHQMKWEHTIWTFLDYTKDEKMLVWQLHEQNPLWLELLSLCDTGTHTIVSILGKNWIMFRPRIPITLCRFLMLAGLSMKTAASFTWRNSTVLSGNLVLINRNVSLWNLLCRCFWISSSSKLRNLHTEHANWILERQHGKEW